MRERDEGVRERRGMKKKIITHRDMREGERGRGIERNSRKGELLRSERIREKERKTDIN